MISGFVKYFLVLNLFLLTTGCIYQSSRNSAVTDSNTAVAQQTEPSDATSVKSFDRSDKTSDLGDFLVEHTEPKQKRFAEYERKIREEKMLEKAADTLNRSLILPYDVTFRAKECGEINALYDSADRSITVCYEIMEHFYKLFRSEGTVEEEAGRKMFDAVRFAFLHELGHALIDAYDLPLTGNEEDAADRLSSYICLEEMGEDGIRAVLAAADAFKIEAENATPKNEDMADEHLLQEQRFYNTLCMIYGSDTKKYDYFVSRKYLPENRAARCPKEYERMAKSWSELLEKWRKD
jgi:hypothetical protein